MKTELGAEYEKVEFFVPYHIWAMGNKMSFGRSGTNTDMLVSCIWSVITEEEQMSYILHLVKVTNIPKVSIYDHLWLNKDTCIRLLNKHHNDPRYHLANLLIGNSIVHGTILETSDDGYRTDFDFEKLESSTRQWLIINILSIHPDRKKATIYEEMILASKIENVISHIDNGKPQSLC
jgi:hypothetical protein